MQLSEHQQQLRERYNLVLIIEEKILIPGAC